MDIVNLDKKPEIYSAIQGEGKSIGKPLIFIRLAGCDLRCQYCDTKYSWDINQAKMDIDDIISKIIEIAPSSEKGIVFTGGEPLLQQKEIVEFINKLDGGWNYFEIETNGTIPLISELYKKVNLVNCSPKLENSKNPLALRRKENALKQISEMARNGRAIFKFVVIDQGDIEEIKLLRDQYNIPNRAIYLMPEGIEREEIIIGSRILASICIKEGWNLSPRLQIILYGNKRGT